MAIQTITRLYDVHEDAVHAVAALEAAGIPHADVSLVANNVDNRYPMDTAGMTVAATPVDAVPSSDVNVVDADGHRHTVGPAPSVGSGLGTLLGGGAGLLAGIGALAIPGVGPIVAAGWLVTTLAGAGVGGAAGGLLDALVGAGVHHDDAHVHVEGVRRGGSLVTVRADDAMAPTIQAILDGRTPVNLETRRADYETGGWTAHDPMLPAMTSEEVIAERARVGSGTVL